MSYLDRWDVVIGLEVHTQLSTKSKLFSGSSTAYGAEPNTQASAVDIALPGALPVMNSEAAKLAIRFGLAIGAKINQRSFFERKNYFYPDSPKAYQISQFITPIVGEGSMTIETDEGEKTIGVTRAHLEEDAGKSLHDAFSSETGIDLNRVCTPLIEIVSDPDLSSSKEAVAYLRKLHTLVRYIGISDGNMQEGSFRCDANVSLKPKGSTTLGTRTELKNINSFRFVERAIEYEIERQLDILEDGGQIVQETRLYDADNDETRSMRSKEEAHDYRYFPDPDLPPMVISDEVVAEIKASLPELPEARIERFMGLGLSSSDAGILVTDRAMADYFDASCETSSAKPNIVNNWLVSELASYLNKADINIGECPIASTDFANLLNRITDSTISGKIAKEVLAAMWESEGKQTADQVIEAKGLKQITDSGAIESMVKEIIDAHPEQVQQFLAGEQKMIGFFVGQAMKASGGKANPKQVNEILRAQLNK
ncbi:MAG: aspartyl-tRNA(Asn)/glutamyl-tRNA(Gln) amidotransferase subunit B [Saprospiraceae bacterium]|jgi:aspartyl-tRNA(Asn)/glutamyl-tRNA(Gln) amidotransferase subunit B